MDINVDKSDIIVFSKKRNPPNVAIMYGSSILKQKDNVNHLGVRQDHNMKCSYRIQERCQKAKNALFAMASQGIHAYGLNPLLSCDLYIKISMPIMLYGSELWNNVTSKDKRMINGLQHFVVKKIQGLNVRTRSDKCESMLGLHKLYS